MAEETAITQVTHSGEAFRVQGVHQGRRADFTVDAKTVKEMEKTEGRKGVEAFFKRSLQGTTEGTRYDLHP